MPLLCTSPGGSRLDSLLIIPHTRKSAPLFGCLYFLPLISIPACEAISIFETGQPCTSLHPSPQRAFLLRTTPRLCSAMPPSAPTPRGWHSMRSLPCTDLPGYTDLDLVPGGAI